MKINKTKNKSIGTWICSFNLINIEILINSSSFDWFTIDLEHSALTLSECYNIVSYLKANDKKCYVRMSDHNPSNISRVLDFGVDGIIVPMVKNLDEVESIIQAAHYPPRGSRGTGLFRAQQHGDEFSSYVSNANKKIEIILQIEHFEAIKNLNGFIKCKEVNGFILGPYDLSASINQPGNFTNPEFKSLVKSYEKLCLNSSKKMGYHLPFPDFKKLKNLVDKGYNFIGLSTDILLFKNQINTIRSEIKKL
mgnify:CR=1 FL=1